MGNTEIAARLTEMRMLMEFAGEPFFKFMACERAASAIENAAPVAELIAAGTLTELPGIGKSIAGRVAEIAATGTCAYLEELRAKYPPTLINEHVEGEVVLYAVIRTDGSVDSVELVRGLDEQLDANAMEALSQWKFRPASRQGAPVDLEAIVHIPFHASNDR